jgi:hypothetical protein
MGGKFLAKGHGGLNSLEMLFAASLAGRHDCFNPARTICCVAAPPPREVVRGVEPSTGDLVSHSETGTRAISTARRPACAYRSGAKKSKPTDRAARKGDLGRALRTVYDDTLREPVPDDFAKLIGKLI